MKKSGLFLLASLMLFILCSFSSPVQPEQNRSAQTEQIMSIEVQNPLVGDCMAAGLAWAEAFTSYMVSEDPALMLMYGALIAYWSYQWLTCIY